MGVPTVNSLGQFIHYVGWRGLIGIAHPEINNVFAPRPRSRLQLSNNVENIGRQAFDALEIVIQVCGLRSEFIRTWRPDWGG